MIASLQGRVEHVGLGAAVIVVGGVGLAVQATPATLATLRVGEEARLATSLVVREDSLTLMGFETDDERDVYETLQTVSGIGPKVALAMLAVHTPDALRRAIMDEDQAALMRVPGIGKKGAQRILLEIGDKLGPPRELVAAGDGAGASAVAAPTPAAGSLAAMHPDAPAVVEALNGLGWQNAAAERAVAKVLEERVALEAAGSEAKQGGGGDAGQAGSDAGRASDAQPAPGSAPAPLNTATLLRAALQELGAHRG